MGYYPKVESQLILGLLLSHILGGCSLILLLLLEYRFYFRYHSYAKFSSVGFVF